jgi:hypothetical protein
VQPHSPISDAAARIWQGVPIRAPAREADPSDELQDDEQQVLVVNIRDLHPRGMVDMAACDRVAIDGGDGSIRKLADKALEPGDVLITIRGATYAVSLVPPRPWGSQPQDQDIVALAAPHLAVLRFDDERQAAVAMSWLSSAAVRQQLADKSSASMRVMIPMRELQQLNLPALDEDQLTALADATRAAADYERATRAATQLRYELLDAILADIGAAE